MVQAICLIGAFVWALTSASSAAAPATASTSTPSAEKRAPARQAEANKNAEPPAPQAGKAEPATNNIDSEPQQDEPGSSPGADGGGDDTPAVDPPPSTYDRRRRAQGKDPAEGPTLIGQLVRTLFALAVVVGLIYLVAKVGLARLTKLRGFGSTHMRTLDRLQLDPKSSLYLVQVHSDKVFLVGTGEHGVRYVQRLDDAEALAMLQSAAETGNDGKKTSLRFSELLGDKRRGDEHGTRGAQSRPHDEDEA